MERREILLNLTDDPIILPLIERMLFLEGEIEKLEKLPMIRINPNNPEQQKTTPAAKLYKELLQQYTNVIKVIARATGEDDKVEDSPLRAWVNSRNADL